MSLFRVPLLAAIVLLPFSGPSAQELPDTAGAHLRRTWQIVRRSAPDARLVEISGKTDSSGTVQCNAFAPFQDGWRFTFHSQKTQEYWLMADCRGRSAGPLKELRDTQARPLLPIEGAFADSDEALELLASFGVSLDPRKYKVPPKRPFTMKLSALNDPHFPSVKPVLWTVSIGRSSFLIDALKRVQFDPTLYGVDPEDLLPPEEKARLEANLAQRPKKRPGTFTALSDLEKARALAGRKYPGSQLMAIEGFVDAWGGSPCVGAGDGWAYYFLDPATSGFAVLFACKGDVGPGAVTRVPVDAARHQPLGDRFVDSDAIADKLLAKQPDAMHEGMGRNYTRHGTLRLLNYKAPPYSDPALSRTTLFWVLDLGSTRYTFDARSGRMLQAKE
ncbi:MAG: hypothetical protein HY922_07510 [Elusimicrobia bacterium]|nr:hypothetical protein [Elusimicrobiota bacterium]